MVGTNFRERDVNHKKNIKQGFLNGTFYENEIQTSNKYLFRY